MLIFSFLSKNSWKEKELCYMASSGKSSAPIKEKLKLMPVLIFKQTLMKKD